MALTYSDFLVRGLSSDTKPTTHPNTGAALPSGWRFYETDTNGEYWYNGSSWIALFVVLSSTGTMPLSSTDLAQSHHHALFALPVLDDPVVEDGCSVPGPAGPPGVQGSPGADGAPGAQGLPGQDGDFHDDVMYPVGHGILSHQSFPGGTTTFLRADNTFASAVVDPNPQSYTPGSFTVATGKYVILSKRLQLTGTQRLTVAGTARMRIT